MPLGWTDPLLLFAFDHRSSFQKLLGVAPDADDAAQAQVRAAKRVVFDGFVTGLDRLSERRGAAILVDEQYGAELVALARERGALVAMPVERSGQDEFGLEYGADFVAHVASFDPDFVKVLVRYNPEADESLNARQNAGLRDVSRWCAEQGRRFLLEYLLPPTPAQLDAVDGSRERFDSEIRPALMPQVVEQMQDAGVEADVWKVEGLDSPADDAAVSTMARRDGRDSVSCVVLGRGASLAKVGDWLRTGAGVPGYVGFAVGRSIWTHALTEYLAGTLARDAAVEEIGQNYADLVDTWRSALALAPPIG
jgi:myo-inositol catabolism protein IolC